MADINKIIDNATEEELGNILITVSKKLSEIRRERASNIRLGSIVTYSGDRQGKVVGITEEGVTITADDLKNRRKLDWADIETIL